MDLTLEFGKFNTSGKAQANSTIIIKSNDIVLADRIAVDSSGAWFGNNSYFKVGVYDVTVYANDANNQKGAESAFKLNVMDIAFQDGAAEISDHANASSIFELVGDVSFNGKKVGGEDEDLISSMLRVTLVGSGEQAGTHIKFYYEDDGDWKYATT